MNTIFIIKIVACSIVLLIGASLVVNTTDRLLKESLVNSGAMTCQEANTEAIGGYHCGN